MLSGARAGLALESLGTPGLSSSAGKAKESDDMSLVHLQLQASTFQLLITPCPDIHS